MSEKRVLIIGASGMLGSMVSDYFLTSNNEYILGFVSNTKVLPLVHKTAKSYLYQLDIIGINALQVMDGIMDDFKPDFVINCTGIVSFPDNNEEAIKNAIHVNALFPHQLNTCVLSANNSTKIIHITSDGVFNGSKGNYNELDIHDNTEVYGRTKSLGECISTNLLNIRCSIIGPELFGNRSLLQWFLSKPDGSRINGFENHIWNGVTTLQIAELFESIILGHKDFDTLRNLNHVFHFFTKKTVSKYELLEYCKKVFGKEITIDNIQHPISINRSLKSINPQIGECTVTILNSLFLLKKYLMERSIVFKNHIG